MMDDNDEYARELLEYVMQEKDTPDTDVVLLIFKNENGSFHDARLVATDLNRSDIDDAIDMYMRESFGFECCKANCGESLQKMKPGECRICKYQTFSVDAFLSFLEEWGCSRELINSGIIVYNNITIKGEK